ncbi:hypothetical protein VLY81_10865 [Geochorda subterranea]|uniref:Uncharacterized protein n=1 Tax=Geochorda subterranea TaxID=3109564 RepID=A0ABZ1BMK6_9FIRM|nr:hypothetical protein [Limnochorda sp. LNt]WRP13924.1 hypothetical protein VLY81_10865 [Limnochorda sp. LNt]
MTLPLVERASTRWACTRSSSTAPLVLVALTRRALTSARSSRPLVERTSTASPATPRAETLPLAVEARSETAISDERTSSMPTACPGPQRQSPSVARTARCPGPRSISTRLAASCSASSRLRALIRRSTRSRQPRGPPTSAPGTPTTRMLPLPVASSTTGTAPSAKSPASSWGITCSG